MNFLVFAFVPYDRNGLQVLLDCDGVKPSARGKLQQMIVFENKTCCQPCGIQMSLAKSNSIPLIMKFDLGEI